jgi:two-component system, OmpR family, response regulator
MTKAQAEINHTQQMSGSASRLLLVEDDVKLARTVQRGLEHEGYVVDVAHTGDDALAQGDSHDYDAVILDVLLPGRDGYSVCQALRKRDRWVPVLMLTALGEVADRIRGLDTGADDYLVKPFDFGELVARVRALIRRGPSERPAPIEIGGLRADPMTRVVTWAGHDAELTPREYDVLEFMLRRPGQLISRSQLLDHVWSSDYDGSPNVVDVYIGYIRRKLDRPRAPRLIRTVRGAGFVLDAAGTR